MNVKNSCVTTAFVLGILSGCAKGKVKEIPVLANDVRLTEIIADTFSRKIPDASKIIHFNKICDEYRQAGERALNYAIVNKKKCEMIVYSPKGDTLERFRILLGRHIGDKRAGGYADHSKNPRCYTAPGDFEISYIGQSRHPKDARLYGTNLFFLKGDHTEKAYIGKQSNAIHQIPDSWVKTSRLRAMCSKTLADNRKSFGCVELTAQDCNKLKKYLVKGSKVYVLPEEKGNSLALEKLDNGTYKFVQTKYPAE